jgi:hypothetical protein
VTSTTGPFDQETFEGAVNTSSIYVRNNIDLQWSEGFFRGFFTLEVSPKTLNATYYSMRNVSKHLFLLYIKPCLLIRLVLKLSAIQMALQLRVSSSMPAKTAWLVLSLGARCSPVRSSHRLQTRFIPCSVVILNNQITKCMSINSPQLSVSSSIYCIRTY